MSVHTVNPTGGNDSATWNAAISAASSDLTGPTGPSGSPQGVVHANAGTYRLTNISIPSNVRIEIDAGAIIQQVNGASDSTIFSVDAGGANSPITNVTIIGVGSNQANKEVGHNGRPTYGMFVANLDCSASGGNPDAKFIDTGNCSYVRYQNIYFQGYDADLSGGAFDNTSPHLNFHSNSSSVVGGPYYHPRHILCCNLYGVAAPQGYGITQITSGENLQFYYVYGRGGIPIRMETDYGSQEGQGIPARLGGPSGLAGVYAEDIIGEGCNAVIDFSPHYQTNYNCNVKNILGLSAQYTIRTSDFIGGGGVGGPGSFISSSYDSVTCIAGPVAQNDATGASWTIGASKKPLNLAASSYSVAGSNVRMLEGSNATDGRTVFATNNTEGVTVNATGYVSSRVPCADLAHPIQPRHAGSSLYLGTS